MSQVSVYACWPDVAKPEGQGRKKERRCRELGNQLEERAAKSNRAFAPRWDATSDERSGRGRMGMEEVEMDMKVPRPGSTGRARVGGGLAAVAVAVALLTTTQLLP